jgi:ribosomal-protein-alanine N-acetyltransferase
LREISKTDATDLFALRSNKDLMRHIDRPLAETMQDALNLIEIIITSLKNNDGITWGIALKNNLQLIGTIGFWRIIKEHHRAEIGYLLSDAFQRQGLMQEAITAVINYGFNVLQLHSIEGNVNPPTLHRSCYWKKINLYAKRISGRTIIITESSWIRWFIHY